MSETEYEKGLELIRQMTAKVSRVKKTKKALGK
jgi:hypothetical protein